MVAFSCCDFNCNGVRKFSHLCFSKVFSHFSIIYASLIILTFAHSHISPAFTQEPVVAPLETQAPSDEQTEVDNATVRSEDVSLISGSGLSNYSVVVGSFSLKANAEGLASTLKSAGYESQIVLNTDRNMYRVVASTFADKTAAVKSRNKFRAGKYPDAWLLLKK